MAIAATSIPESGHFNLRIAIDLQAYNESAQMGSLIYPQPVLTSERELHRLRTALRGSVVDGFDVVAVGVQREGAVVAEVVRALAGLAVVPAPVGECGAMEGVDHRAVAGLEGDVVAAGEFAPC